MKLSQKIHWFEFFSCNLQMNPKWTCRMQIDVSSFIKFISRVAFISLSPCSRITHRMGNSEWKRNAQSELWVKNTIAKNIFSISPKCVLLLWVSTFFVFLVKNLLRWIFCYNDSYEHYIMPIFVYCNLMKNWNRTAA